MYRSFNRPRTNFRFSVITACLIMIAATIVFPTAAFAADETIQTPTIVGGVEADKEYPWAVALVKTGLGSAMNRQFCGGTLIDPEWVLTAAHCTYIGSVERPTDAFNVLVGTAHLNDGQGEEVQILDVIRHPEYNDKTNNMDLALLRLARAVSYPTIEMGNAALLDRDASSQLLTLGWGRTEDVARSDSLRQVDLPLVDAETCRAAYARYGYAVLDNMLCAGYAQGGKDACSGDSGGPLVAPKLFDASGEVQEWALVGVVSWGVGCAQQNAYGVYVDVGYVADWVTVQMESYSAPASVISAQASTMTIYLPLVQ